MKAGPRKLRIISTPNGHNNKFAQLWTSTPIPGSLLIPAPSQAAPPIPTLHINPKSPAPFQPANQQSETINQKSTPAFLPSQSENQKSEIINHKSSATVFSRHYVTIHHAVAAGLPINIPLLQRGLADNEAFAQEYECQFLDQSTVLLPYDLIATCESDLATETSTPALLSTCPGEKFLGIDFGRKHDLTVAWFLEKIALHPDPHPSIPPSILKTQSHLFLTREVLILRNASTPQQIEALTPRINLARRVCLDYTGPGIGLGDILVRQFGECKSGGAPLPSSQSGLAGKVELCTFTQSLKNELFTHLRSAFERRLLAIPPSTISTDIREDLHSIYRIISNNGQVSYRAFHSPDGHSDRCTALALALRAAESAPTVACASTVGTKFRSPGRPRRFV